MNPLMKSMKTHKTVECNEEKSSRRRCGNGITKGGTHCGQIGNGKFRNLNRESQQQALTTETEILGIEDKIEEMDTSIKEKKNIETKENSGTKHPENLGH